MRRSGFTWLQIVLVVMLLLILPKFISEYRLNLVITMMIYSIFALSYNMLFGQGGLLSFGHAAYFGFGAYATVILIKQMAVSLPVGILFGGLAGAFLGVGFGIFVVRMRGVPFALLTLAFNQLIYVTAEKWRAVTGGEDGLAFMRPNLHLAGWEIDLWSTLNWYYFVLLVTVIAIGCLWYLTLTPLGRLNLCMRENEERARFIGYNTYASRLLIYTQAGFFAGVAGGLAASFQEFVTTTFINLDKATEVLMITFIGGGGTFFGPVIGACALTLINDLLSSWLERWAIVQGVLFILLVLYAPNGLSGLYLSLREHWARRRRGEPQP
jgi:branched-chain amino acid transport system permease protein